MKSSRLNRQPHTTSEIKNELYIKNSKTMTYGTESISFMAAKIWSIVPEEMKNCRSLYSFEESGNDNQTVHVGYAKPTCNMLVFCKKCMVLEKKKDFHFCYLYAI